MLNSKQRAWLRSQANSLDPVFQVGKGEIDDSVVKATADILAEATGADVVQVIGSKFVLFLKKDKDSKFDELPR